MARHTKIWVCDLKGRDHGKAFKLTEWGASKAEKWAYRALLAIINQNVQLPEGFEAMGWAGLAQIGYNGLTGLQWPLAEPLLDEMMQGIQIIPEYPKHNNPRLLEDGDGPPGSGDYDIEEVTTRAALRAEVFKLHVDFSGAAAQSLIERVKAVVAARGLNTATESQS